MNKTTPEKVCTDLRLSVEREMRKMKRAMNDDQTEEAELLRELTEGVRSPSAF